MMGLLGGGTFGEVELLSVMGLLRGNLWGVGLLGGGTSKCGRTSKCCGTYMG